MNRVLCLAVILPILANAQYGKVGIDFKQDLNWMQLKTKAKAENKYIFVDCFATWCGPCKYMDKMVFSRDTVGDYVNSQFISVKAQMDTSKLDNADTRKWYGTSHEMLTQYKISSIPTYLFFSPEGKLVHRGLGSQNASGFILLAKSACDSSRQYYTLLEKYKLGLRKNIDLPYLANTAKNLQEKSLANIIARDYFDNFLFNLSEDELIEKHNLEFIYAFADILSLKDKGFDLFYHYGNRVDSIMKISGLSMSVVDFVIAKSEINPVVDVAIKNGTDPDWKKCFKAIRTKYDAYSADRIILNAKVGFYKNREEWKKYTRNLVVQVEKYGVGDKLTAFFLNNNAWSVFQHSNNRQELRKALSWSERAVQLDSISPTIAQSLDTHANLLYKLGRKEEALAVEERAVQLSPKDTDIQQNLGKMKNDIPTWELK